MTSSIPRLLAGHPLKNRGPACPMPSRFAFAAGARWTGGIFSTRGTAPTQTVNIQSHKPPMMTFWLASSVVTQSHQ